jgi:hypothetical protein
MSLPKGKAESGQELLQELKKALGLALLEIIFSVPSTTINKWIKGDQIPNPETAKVISLLGYIWETLTGSMSVKDSKLWLVTHSEYLYGIPATEIRSRPEDVYLAVLHRISRGEDQDRIRVQLESLHDSHESQIDDSESP